MTKIAHTVQNEDTRWNFLLPHVLSAVITAFPDEFKSSSINSSGPVVDYKKVVKEYEYMKATFQPEVP